ncbi:MAG: hypothetical protein R3F43_26810 [bacterium]
MPCAARFASVTYVRDAHAVRLAGNEVLVGTSGGLLSVVGDQIERMTSADGTAGNRVRSVTVDGEGRRWLATDRGVVLVRRTASCSACAPVIPAAGPRGDLRDVAVDGAGTVWVSSDRGSTASTPRAGLVAEGLPSNDVRGLLADGLGRVWAATAGGVVRVTGGAASSAPSTGCRTWAASWGGAGGGRGVAAGRAGAIRLGADDGVVASFSGLRGAGRGARGRRRRYLATEAGVKRIDGAGRAYAPGAALLSPDVRGAAGRPDGPLARHRGRRHRPGWVLRTLRGRGPALDLHPDVRAGGRSPVDRHRRGAVLQGPDGSYMAAGEGRCPAAGSASSGGSATRSGWAPRAA